MENNKKMYIETTNKINELRDNLAIIKENIKENNIKLMSAYDNITNWRERTQEQTNAIEEKHQEEKRLSENKKLIETIYELLGNNLLHIQRNLLFEGGEILKNSKYYLKPFGEKTKEKMQNEIKETLKNKYDIDIYVYINQSYEYNRDNQQQELCYELEIVYEDFYYEYELKQEKIRIFENARYYYYYNDIGYTKINDLEKVANKIIEKHKTANEKIEKLTKQINQLIDDNNKDIIGFLSKDYRIEKKYY